VENAIHILVLHFEDILFAQKFPKLDAIILLQTLEDILMLVWRPKVSRDICHLLTCSCTELNSLDSKDLL